MLAPQTLSFSLARSRTKSRTGKIVRDHGPVRARFVAPPYDLVVPPYDLVVASSEHPAPVRDLALTRSISHRARSRKTEGQGGCSPSPTPLRDLFPPLLRCPLTYTPPPPSGRAQA